MSPRPYVGSLYGAPIEDSNARVVDAHETIAWLSPWLSDADDDSPTALFYSLRLFNLLLPLAMICEAVVTFRQPVLKEEARLPEGGGRLNALLTACLAIGERDGGGGGGDGAGADSLPLSGIVSFERVLHELRLAILPAEGGLARLGAGVVQVSEAAHSSLERWRRFLCFVGIPLFVLFGGLHTLCQTALKSGVNSLNTNYQCRSHSSYNLFIEISIGIYSCVILPLFVAW